MDTMFLLMLFLFQIRASAFMFGLHQPVRRSCKFLPSHDGAVQFDEYDVHATKELQWLLKTTTSIIGYGESPPPGELSLLTLRKVPVVMNTWLQRCRSNNSNAVHVIEKILERLLIEKKYGNKFADNVLNVSVYNIVIDAWARTSGVNRTVVAAKQIIGNNRIVAAKRAQDILEQLEQPDEDQNVRANIKSYFLALKAWVKSKDPIAIGSMLGILYRMEQSDVFESDPKMTVRCYNLYLYALANANAHPISTMEQALTIFDKMKRKNLCPDTNTYNQIISCLANVKGKRSAEKAQALLDEMMLNDVPVNTDTFNGIINCWLKSHNNAKARQQIERIIDIMVQLSSSGNEDAFPDHYTINMLLTAVGQSGRKDSVRRSYFILMNMEEKYGKFGVSPDSTSFNLVLRCYSKSKDIQAGEKALKLLDIMETRFKNGDCNAMPDAYTYSTVIDSLISPLLDSGRAAEDIIHRMEQLHISHNGEMPSTTVYNALIKAYATVNELESIYRAQEILEHMETSFAAGSSLLKPNIVTYNSVLKAYAQPNTTFCSKAEQLLLRMEQKHANGELEIDVFSYTTVITSYARSAEPLKARNAERILLKMIDAYNNGNKSLKPSVYAFNACLNACAYTHNQKEKVDAFRVAVSTLVLLQKYCKPDHTTYGTLIRAWSNLFPKDDERRDKIIDSVFQQSCKEGQMGQMVLQQLKFAASPDLYRSLLGKDIADEVCLAELHPEWSKNVRERYPRI
jgi:hypothetical protein